MKAKRIVFLIVLVVTGFALISLSSPVSAQTRTRLNMFSTMTACKTAMASGDFRYYEPKYFGLNANNPLNGVDRVPVPLESDTCLNMFVVGGWKFVVQKEGTVFRGEKLADGSLTLYARDDCGNPVRGVVYPAPVVQAQVYVRQSAPSPILIPYPIDMIRPIEPPAKPAVRGPVERYYPEESSTSQEWNQGLTASGMVGPFRSVPISGAIEGIAGRQVCVNGRMFDVGFAHGGQKSSIWRLTLVAKTFDEGSYTQYDCPECNLTVRTVAESGVRVMGFQVERVQRISWNPNWAIQPMVSVNAGLGHISGGAQQQARTTQEVGAKELFGSSWFPMAGVGVGVMGDLGQHLTWTVTAGGIEYPGVYYGRVGLTYWLK